MLSFALSVFDRGSARNEIRSGQKSGKLRDRRGKKGGIKFNNTGAETCKTWKFSKILRTKMARDKVTRLRDNVRISCQNRNGVIPLLQLPGN